MLPNRSRGVIRGERRSMSFLYLFEKGQLSVVSRGISYPHASISQLARGRPYSTKYESQGFPQIVSFLLDLLLRAL